MEQGKQTRTSGKRANREERARRVGQASAGEQPRVQSPAADQGRMPNRAGSRRVKTTITRWRMFGVTAWAALMLVGGLIGYITAPVKSYWRVLLIAGGLGLLIPGAASDAAGVALIAVVYFFNLRKKNEEKGADEA